MTTFDHDDTGAPGVPATDRPIPPPPPSSPRRQRSAVRGGVLAIALATAFGAGLGAGQIDFGPPAPAGAAATGDPASSVAPGDEFALIREAWDTVHQNYVDAGSLDDEKLAYGAIDGLTEAIGDTGHTTFLTPDERATRNAALSGSYVGIGAEVDSTPDGLPLIVGVFRESGGQRRVVVRRRHPRRRRAQHGRGGPRQRRREGSR